MTEHATHLAQHIDLQDLNTFALHSVADNYVDVSDVNHLKNLCQQQHPQPYWIIGGGSNILLQPHIKGTVWHMNLKGIELLREDAEHAHIKVSAGENWHQFVLHTLSKNYYGLENLSLIPGSVGGAPVQNIGAYGVLRLPILLPRSRQSTSATVKLSRFQITIANLPIATVALNTNPLIAII